MVMPISPHTLTNRPVVNSADRVFEMAVPRPGSGTAVIVDGRMLCRLLPGDRVRVGGLGRDSRWWPPQATATIAPSARSWAGADN